MSPTYRDDRDAALARADALHRENQRLRDHVAALRLGAEPASDDRPAAVHYRSAAAAAVLLLGAMAGAGFVAHDTREVAAPDAIDACVSERAEPAFSDEAARRVLPPVAASLPLPALALSPEVRDGPTREGVTVAPLLHACFAGLRGHVDVLAAIDGRGHLRRVRVLSDTPGARAVRAERRCVRRSLRAMSFPTTYATFTAYERDAALGLTVLPYDRVASR